MAIIRIILLLVVLGGLTLLLVQNWSPVLPLVFLGVRTQALPLAVWILLSIAAGAFTSLFITGLFNLSNYFARSSRSKRRNVIGRWSAERKQADKTPASSSKPDTDSTPSDTEDDWDSDSTSDDDWDFEQDTDKTPNFSSQNTVRDSTTYEASTEPKSGYRSGSVYSYSYREPSNSGVGKTESIHDADYRVIAPPYRETDKPAEDEDWGFEDDDDFKDEGKSDSPKPGNY
jgi:uncharacterized integral membrane protein